MANIISRICLECRNDATNTYKFWQAEINADLYQLTVTWGRIGTKGQSKTHQCSNIRDAESKLEQLKRAKLNKGYTELFQPSKVKSIPTVKTAKTVKSTIDAPQVNAAILLLNALRPYVEKGNFSNLGYAEMLNDFVELAPFLQIKPDPQTAFRDVVSLEDARRTLLLKKAALQ
jgi:predicted DNA-binding WGR domain protein